MSPGVIRAACRFLGAVALICFLSAAWARAADAKEDGQDQKYGLSQPTYERLTKARTLLEQQRHREALAVLEALLPQVQDNAYEMALTHQSLAYVHLGRKDYRRAIEAMEAALEKHSLPPEVIHSLRYNLAQVYIQTEAYRQGLQALQQWLAEEKNPPAEAYYLAAIAHHRLKQFDAAITELKQAMNKAGKAREEWEQFLLSLYFETKWFQEAIPILNRLIAKYPQKKDYWRYLTDVYLQLKREPEALAILKQAYRLDVFDEVDRVRLAQLYLRRDIPFSAARLLEREMARGRLPRTASNVELLGNSWAMALDPKRAVAALQQAANSVGHGNLHMSVAQMQMGMEHWADAAKSLKRAISKGGLQDPDYAQLLLGISCYQQGDTKRAAAALEKASKNQRYRAQAQRWLEQIQKQISVASNQR